MKKLTSNFYPAHEVKDCANEFAYLGKADITIANAIRINGISVFLNAEGKYSLRFPEFGEGVSYVVPHSAEVYAAMLDVVSKAVVSKDHFGYNTGDYGVHLKVSGDLVQEPYADGRFHAEVDDICTLYGITTRHVEYEKEDGKTGHFVAVNAPNIYTYEKDGEKQYQTAFEGRKSVWTKDGEEHQVDYGQILEGKVRAERKALIKERKPALDDQVKDAQSRKKAQKEKANNAPTKERG